MRAQEGFGLTTAVTRDWIVISIGAPRTPADHCEIESRHQIPAPCQPSARSYNDITATLNGKDILPQMQLKDSALVLSHAVKPGEVMDLKMSFKSRGMSSWYMQVSQGGARDHATSRYH